MFIIILVVIILVITLYILITPVYFPNFALNKNLQLGEVSTKGLIADTLFLKTPYITTLTPHLLNIVPPPLTPAVLGTGTFNAQLEGFPSFYSLNAGSQNAVLYHVKIPNGWKTNTPLSTRVHFAPSNNTAGILDLRLWHKKATVGTTFENEFDNVRISKEIFLNTQNDHLTALFPELVLLNETDQTLIIFALERQANGGDSVDTYSGNITILSIEVEFQVNKLGSIA